MSTTTKVKLKDESNIVVRSVRRGDGHALQEGYKQLSQESRYHRFLSAMPELSPSLLAYLTDVDHHDHEALLAVAPGGAIVGVARFVRAEQPDAAEAAVVVVDDWQGKGVASCLLTLLAARGRSEGIERFTALVLNENIAVRRLLQTLASVRLLDRSQGTIEIEVRLSELGAGGRAGRGGPRTRGARVSRRETCSAPHSISVSAG